MDQGCVGCMCTSARTTPTSGRLVLATRVDHTVAALRSLAGRHGLTLRPLAAGLLGVDTTDPTTFIAAARTELTSVEAEEVRCMVLEPSCRPDLTLLSQAMTAPSLAAAGARVLHADLLPLFEDEQRSFYSDYQPIVDLAQRRTVGYEALLRATDAAGDIVMPDRLFPAAEAAGWTHLLDRIGRTTALRGAGAWLGDALLFINFVPTSIYRPEVCLRTTELAAEEAGVRLDQLVFEVTEGHRIHDLDHLERVFDYYRERGCRVAIDDLGAGFSSLNLLVRLRPDIVKLDKDLVQSLPGPVGAAVVSAIVDITHSYGGLVLAECIETAEQEAAARELGVDLGQGWAFGRPERPAPTAAASARPVARPVVHVRRPDPALPDPAVGLKPEAAPDELDPASAGLSALLARAVDAGVGGVCIVDVQAPDQPVVYVNHAFEQMTGYAAAEVIGRNCRLLQGPETDPEVVTEIRRAVVLGQEIRAVVRNYRRDGSPWWNELHLSPVLGPGPAAAPTHYRGFQHDVTDRVDAEQNLALLATRDSLTGLANRAALFDRLDLAVERAREEHRALVVLLLGLDGFKAVNDTLGHSAGDSVLVQVAERVRAVLRTGDLLARNGGDEFVALLTGLDPLDAGRVALRAASDVTASLARPFAVGPAQARLGGSVGVAVYPEHGDTSSALLASADAAMYRAKQAGTGQTRLVDGPPAVLSRP